jgi:phospholipid/cholesterol/gamma-HCH transport system ATP-binding protein
MNNKTIAQPKISVKNLQKRFGSKEVLKGINFELNQGESLVVMGGSGTGKSVMLKCILNLLSADSGSILLDGEELLGAKPPIIERARSKIGVLFQGAALFDSLPVWENIFFAPLQKKLISKQEARVQAQDRLAAVGLQKEVADLRPAELSGGMQRRVGLARAGVEAPGIIFFDEPTAGLDPIISGVINDLIVKNVKELGATTITITHDMASARHIADKIAMIHQGKIVWFGDRKDLDHSGNPYVEQFISGRIEGPIRV